MYIYSFGYFLLFIGSILWIKTKPSIKPIYITGLIYISLIVILRGNVGTDTGNYESIISGIYFDSFLYQPTEIGFNFSVVLLKLTGISSSAIILRLLTAVYMFLLFLIIREAKANFQQIILIFFIPATVFVFSMNALRLGISINLFILALLFFKRNRILFYSFLLLSISFHVTIVLVMPLFFIFQKNSIRKLLSIFFLLFLAIIFFVIFHQHIGNKLELYSDYSSPNPYSGLSSVLSFMMLIPFIWTYPTNSRYKIFFVSVMTMLITISFVIAKFSYAGLRMLQLYVLFSPIIFVYMSNIKYGTQQLKKHSFWLLLFATFIYTLFILKNFFDSSDSPYGFIPYSFIF